METVRIVNPKQCAFYIKGGVKPLDLFLDENTGRLVYLYEWSKRKKCGKSGKQASQKGK